MSRIRSIHPGLFTDDAFMALSMAARVTLTGLWTEADDHGVFSWKPLTLKARLLPADNIDMNGILGELEANRFLHRFRDGDREFGIIRNFRKYQRPKKPTYSYPFPAEYGSFIGLGSEGSVPVGNQYGTGGELVENRLPTGGEKSPQMKDGGGRREEEGGDYTSSLRSDVCAPPVADVAPAPSPGGFSEAIPPSEPEPYPPPTEPPGGSPPAAQTIPVPDTALIPARDTTPGRITPGSELDEAVKAYNAVAASVGWPEAQLMTPRRRVHLKARLRDAGGLSGWQQAMAKARASPFLRGDNGRDKAHANWTPDLDFFLQQSTFTQLMEGKYDDRGGHSGSGNKHPADIAARRIIAEMYGGGEVQFPV